MKVFCFFIWLLPFFAISQENPVLVQFDTEQLDLGEIKKGSTVKNEFIFTNTSNENVEIEMVSTCDCTEAKWPRGPISPGEKGRIQFIFDSNKKEEIEPVDLDVFFKNNDPVTGNPLIVFLTYTFRYID